MLPLDQLLPAVVVMVRLLRRADACCVAPCELVRSGKQPRWEGRPS